MNSLGVAAADCVVWPACERWVATPPCKQHRSHPIAQRQGQEPRLQQLANVIGLQACPDLRPAVACPTIHAAAARADADADAELEAGRRKLEEWLHTVLGDDKGAVLKRYETSSARRQRMEAAAHRECSKQQADQLEAAPPLAAAPCDAGQNGIVASAAVCLPTPAVASSAPPPVGPPDPGIDTPTSPVYRLPPVEPEELAAIATCDGAAEPEGRAFEEATFGVAAAPGSGACHSGVGRDDASQASVCAGRSGRVADIDLGLCIAAEAPPLPETANPIEAVATPPESTPTSSETPLDDEAYTHAGPTETYGFTLYHISAAGMGETDTASPEKGSQPINECQRPAVGVGRQPSKSRRRKPCKELRSANDLLLW